MKCFKFRPQIAKERKWIRSSRKNNNIKPLKNIPQYFASSLRSVLFFISPFFPFLTLCASLFFYLVAFLSFNLNLAAIMPIVCDYFECISLLERCELNWFCSSGSLLGSVLNTKGYKIHKHQIIQWLTCLWQRWKTWWM